MPINRNLEDYAGMVELVDTRDLKSRALRGVWVQVPLLVLKSSYSGEGFFVLSLFAMATLYILHSASIDKYYIGSCLDLEHRLAQHRKQFYSKGFTKRASDWELFFKAEGLNYDQARKIELHIKRMKSSKYIENLPVHPEIIGKLIDQYN